jgi:hypothetical protein
MATVCSICTRPVQIPVQIKHKGPLTICCLTCIRDYANMNESFLTRPLVKCPCGCKQNIPLTADSAYRVIEDFMDLALDTHANSCPRKCGKIFETHREVYIHILKECEFSFRVRMLITTEEEKDESKRYYDRLELDMKMQEIEYTCNKKLSKIFLNKKRNQLSRKELKRLYDEEDEKQTYWVEKPEHQNHEYYCWCGFY